MTFGERDEAKDENGKELFFPKEKHAIFRDLGLFLFMYLGDGQNLADTLRLEYDGWYFATHGKQLRFLRHKTRERNEDASEVLFPITPEIKKILDKYANEPKLGQRVFPIMSQGITPDKEIWVIQRYNKYIRKTSCCTIFISRIRKEGLPQRDCCSLANARNSSSLCLLSRPSGSMATALLVRNTVTAVT